ncbi:MAG: bifunctional DNA primase/polymerase [Geminicoccaceae bacterium]
MPSVAEAALAYVALGIPVLPLHGIQDGRCGCGRNCDSPGKHPIAPLTPRGVLDASCDTAEVGRWFRAYPTANLGLALGELVVIDEDRPGAVLAAGLELPNCPCSRTGRGHHYVFRANGHALENGPFAEGLDAKTGAAYVVAPPSLHVSGTRYRWMQGHALEDVPPPPLPEAVEQLIRAAHAGRNGAGKDQLHTMFGELKLEECFIEIERLTPESGDAWRSIMLRVVRSLVGRGWRDDAITMMCRRATRRDLGFAHEQTDAFVVDEIRRTRRKDHHPEPDEHTYDQLDGEAPQPTGCRGIDMTPKRTDWLWHPYFPAGELSLLGGRGGVGKGQACASVVARLTTGAPWPDGSEAAPSCHVLWAEAEDSLQKTVIPRLVANRADLARVTFFTETEFAALDLRAFIESRDCRAVVLSPIMSFLPRLRNHNDELEVRAELRRLHGAVDATLCAMVGIAHLNKKTDLDAVERLLGSVAFFNFVRSVVLLATDKERDDMRRWLHAKFNLSVRGPDLLFSTRHVGEDPRDQFVTTEWEVPSGANVDADSFFDRRTGRRGSARDWLVGYLEEHGRSLATDVISAGEQAGHHRGAIQKAQYREPRIEIDKEGFPAQAWWTLK